MPSSQAEVLGHAALKADGDQIAGSYATWHITYTAGVRGIASGGRMRITTDSDSGCDLPQADEPADAEYTTVRAPQGVDPALQVLSHKLLDVLVTGRAIRAGEEITATAPEAPS